eukprot:6208760-Pleurochrysis_carterae.AAC.1
MQERLTRALALQAHLLRDLTKPDERARAEVRNRSLVPPLIEASQREKSLIWRKRRGDHDYRRGGGG